MNPTALTRIWDNLDRSTYVIRTDGICDVSRLDTNMINAYRHLYNKFEDIWSLSHPKAEQFKLRHDFLLESLREMKSNKSKAILYMNSEWYKVKWLSILIINKII